MRHCTAGLPLIDYTTQEYFESKQDFVFPDAQANIAKACLTYLSFDVFGKGCGAQAVRFLKEDNPLLFYYFLLFFIFYIILSTCGLSL